MLEAVINVSEGRRLDVVARIAAAAGGLLLDVHTDPDHHRSVLTLAGPATSDPAEGDAALEEAALAVVSAAVTAIDLRGHAGVHPRLGAADVVPFVPLDGSTMADALAARDRVATRIAAELGIPCVRYGPERTLPDVRRHAADELIPHPTGGICCVGARPVLVAYNLWLAAPATLADARRIAGAVRRPGLRTLGLQVGADVQVSCNLVDPATVGPADAYDAVAAHASIARAELVGLLPRRVLDAVEAGRWAPLDLSVARTIEARR